MKPRRHGQEPSDPGDRWSLAALALVAAGLALRALVAYPEHRYPADADCLLTGLCAFQVLRGEMPVFFSPLRIGSLECHLTAALFPLFGESRDTLALGALLAAGATMLVAHRFYRLLFGRPAALLALLFLALPAPAVPLPDLHAERLSRHPPDLRPHALARRAAGPRRHGPDFGLGLAGGLGPGAVREPRHLCPRPVIPPGARVSSRHGPACMIPSLLCICCATRDQNGIAT